MTREIAFDRVTSLLERAASKLRALRRNTSRLLPNPDALSPPEIFFWQREAGHYNFGDHLGDAVVRRLLNVALSTDSVLVREPMRLLSIGSVLHFARDGDVIWGTGRNGKTPGSSYKFGALDVRALRGPLTHRWLETRIRVPAKLAYGDPGLLVPFLFDLRTPAFQPRPHEQDCHLLIPNINDTTEVPERFGPWVAPPTLPWYELVRRVRGSKSVVTSSLHGLIFAELFGKPVALVRPPTDRRLLAREEPETNFKYDDYYAGTGREAQVIVTSFEEGVDSVALADLNWDFEPLVRAFPFDRFGFDVPAEPVLEQLNQTWEANKVILER